VHQVERHGAVWRKAAALALLCLGLAAIAASDTLHAALLGALVEGKALIAAHPIGGAAFFVLFSAISAMFAFVSSAVLVPVAVLAWGESISLLLLWAGWILGGVLAYLAARYVARPIARSFVSEGGMRRLEGRVPRDASFIFVVLLQLALPSEIPGYVLGLAKYPFFLYLCAVALGEAPYALASIYLGAGFVKAQSGLVLLIGVGLAAVSIAAFYALRGHAEAQKRRPAALRLGRTGIGRRSQLFYSKRRFVESGRARRLPPLAELDMASIHAAQLGERKAVRTVRSNVQSHRAWFAAALCGALLALWVESAAGQTARSMEII
jgi:uncharacterized membrane protein YdjX (TVP38/TMEM64 family)